MSRKIRVPPYYGGKVSTKGPGKYIVDRLPWRKNSVYVEPFMGMLGILVRRDPVKVEIINDNSELVVNWWQQVRENADNLSRLIAATPRSRDVFKECVNIIEEEKEDKLKMAWAFFVVVIQSMIHTEKGNSWTMKYSPNASINLWDGQEVFVSAKRLKNVQIENCCAIKLLEKLSNEKCAVIYCDPPYLHANSSPYKSDDFDRKQFGEVLLNQKGSVAISGYGDEWDHLGFYREEFKCKIMGMTSANNINHMPRTEVLWTNYCTEELTQPIFKKVS